MDHDGENIMVILSSPSGVGKTTFQKKFTKISNHFNYQYLTTTRTPRSNEVDGVDYYFVTKEKFKKLIK